MKEAVTGAVVQGTCINIATSKVGCALVVMGISNGACQGLGQYLQCL